MTPSRDSLARFLANRFYDVQAARRPLDAKTAAAALNAACETAHRVGYGMTGEHVRQTVQAFMRAHPRPPGSGTRQLQAWLADVDHYLTLDLEALR